MEMPLGGKAGAGNGKFPMGKACLMHLLRPWLNKILRVYIEGVRTGKGNRSVLGNGVGACITIGYFVRYPKEY